MSEKMAAEFAYSAADVARQFGVNPKTVSRWADAGLLPCQRTLGGHRRYRQVDVEQLLNRLSLS